MRGKKWALLAASLLLLTVWGCGSNRDSDSGVVTVTPVPESVGSDSCKVCHTAILDLFNGSVHDDDAVAGCEGCHGGGQFHWGTGPIPFPEPGLVQCADCHDVTTRHINGDDPATSYQASQIDPTIEPIVEGYTKVDDCLGCHAAATPGATPWQHDPASTEINHEWADSPHAGHIATDPADTAEVWGHYDWDAENRQSCQRCHTATGLVNFLADTVNYDLTANDFSHLLDWSKAADGTVTSSGQNELLYCWGCHSDVATGMLRNPGNITLDFGYLVGPEQNPGGTPELVVLPDKGAANVCAACHSGRGNDTSIRTSYADNRLSSRFAGHHAPTAGSLYAEVTHTGFEFAGLDYTPVGFLHDDIEINGDTPETGDGPCVGCHMVEIGGKASHTFESVEEDASGTITAIRNQALCDECHGGAINPAVLNEKKAGFEDAKAVLKAYSTNAIPNYKGIDITTSANRTIDILTLNDYGVFQNGLYMNDEPCAYVHNRLYAKRIIFDSIDWIDNGALDGTITIDATAFPDAADWLGAVGNIATRPLF